MGCGIPKLKRSDESSPGKIYSTLKRPQVQTKVGVAYTYHYLDFTLGGEAEPVSSALCLSSVRDLPLQLRDLYLQGFVLAAVHPFVHPCGPQSNAGYRRLHRAVLIRLSDSSEKTQLPCENHHLETDVCLSADQLPDTELIQGYVKKVQDVAELGGFFVGFLHQPSGAPLSAGTTDPEEPLLSLHSSPSSLQGDGADSSPEHRTGATDAPEAESLAESEVQSDSRDPSLQQDIQEADASAILSRDDRGQSPGGGEERTGRTARQNRVELFALFNHLEAPSGHPRYYTVKVPLQVQQKNEVICGLEASWLDHMTQHFSNGALLVDGYFHLENDNGVLSDIPAKSLESIFVFQEGDSTESTPYDAIVVEQWTVIENVEVKTDYIPLLQSLAMYGWRLTCVLPTPIVKTNSDGSLATKQIVFLQRPVLPRRKKDSKGLNLRARNRSLKNSVKAGPKKGSRPQGAETELEEQLDGKADQEEREKVVRKNNENRLSTRNCAGGGIPEEEERVGGAKAETEAEE